MTERTGTTDNRITHFGYDAARRLTSVGFDSNGDGTVDETVSYAYDAGGNRTQMTLPGSKTITYSYDEVGRLIGLRDWDDQPSDFHYDEVGRHMATQRPNGLSSDYAYNPTGHLRRVRHRAGSSLRGQFNYTVDGRGNRTRAFERLATATTVTNTLTKTDTAVTFTRGTWTDVGDFKQTAQFGSQMRIAYTSDEALLTIGTGPDHGQFDLYINDNYWHSFNTYTAQPGEQVIHLPKVVKPDDATTGTLSIKVRSDKHFRSTGRVFRFKQLQVIDATYNERTIDYTYDGLSRLQQADYNTGERIYDYNFDLAGNRIQEALSGTGVTAKTTNYTYNATNQLTNDGTHTLTYDPNGNLTNDGTNTYTWDHANCLTQIGNTTYTYDGLGNRTQQTTNRVVTDYLLDLQPGLVKVLRQSDGTATDHFIHAPRGIHSMENTSGDWTYAVQDGLGSVRGLIDTALGVNGTHTYDPYGNYIGTAPTTAYFGFTGEQTDPNDLLFLRARYYDPSSGVFQSLDPFEGFMRIPMSLNGYSWVEGNTPNMVDPSGRTAALASMLNAGLCQQQPPNPTPTPTECGCGNCDACAGEAYILCHRLCGTPTPPPTPAGNPCASLGEAEKLQVLATFTGTSNLDPSNYFWWDGSIPNVKITYYGSRALRSQGVTQPSQLPAEEAWAVCCGQGAVSIGGSSYRCNLNDADRRTICESSANANTLAGRQDIWVSSGRCGAHPLLPNETCAAPGQTGAVLADPARAGIAGASGEFIGRMFAYVIPSDGNSANGVPLYLNDAGAGVEFLPRQIDIYAGVLNQDSTVADGVNLNLYNTEGNTVCLLASQQVLGNYSPPQ